MNAPTLMPSILETAGVAVGVAGSLLGEALHGADDGEIFLERSESRTASSSTTAKKLEGPPPTTRPKALVFAWSRVETAGYAHASEISEAAIGRAAQSGRYLAKRELFRRRRRRAACDTNVHMYGEDDPLASARTLARRSRCCRRSTPSPGRAIRGWRR